MRRRGPRLNCGKRGEAKGVLCSPLPTLTAQAEKTARLTLTDQVVSLLLAAEATLLIFGKARIFLPLHFAGYPLVPRFRLFAQAPTHTQKAKVTTHGTGVKKSAIHPFIEGKKFAHINISRANNTSLTRTILNARCAVLCMVAL